MKYKNKYIAIIMLAFILVSCEEDLIRYTGGNPAAYSFKNETQVIGVCEPTQQVTVESTIKTDSDRSITVSIDEEETSAETDEYSFSSFQVVIPAGKFIGSTDVTIDFAEVPDNVERELILNLEIPSNGSLNTRGSTAIEYTSACALNEVTFDFVLDDFPGEFAYVIINSDGLIVGGEENVDADGAPVFGNFAEVESFSETFCFPNGDYTLILIDAFGDGFCCDFGNGSATIISNSCSGDEVLEEITSEFDGQQLQVPFSLN